MMTQLGLPGQRRLAVSPYLLVSWLSVLLFLGLWQLSAMFGWVPLVFTSSPSLVLSALARLLLNHGELLYHFWVSGVSYVSGLALAALLGIVAGIAIGWYRDVRAAADPFVSALNAIPRIALFPLIVLWLGIGRNSIVMLVFLSSLLPILVNTVIGVSNLDRQLLQLARSYGASDRQIFLTVALPSSVPYIVTGLRLAAGRAMIGVVVGELWIGQAGLGFLLASAGQRFATDELFAAVVCVAAAGAAVLGGLSRLERRFQTWRPQAAH
jgi:NitT/TauT family transport system permease protein